MVARKKYDIDLSDRNLNGVSKNVDKLLYVLSSGPAKNLWVLSTMIGLNYFDLIPIFDDSKCAQSFIKGFPDQTLQLATINLSILKNHYEGAEHVFFLLNLELKNISGTIFLKEKSGWRLTLDMLTKINERDQ